MSGVTCAECGKRATWENQVGAYVHDDEEGTHDVKVDPYERIRELTGDGRTYDVPEIDTVSDLDNDDGALGMAVLALIETALQRAAVRT